MKINSLRWLAVAAVVLLGCEHDCYEVEIRPDGDGFERRITCWHVGGENDEKISQLASGKLDAIVAIYPKRETSADAKKQTFSGRFVDKTPNDVGGAGRLTKYESPLGSAWSYAERFRGNDDIEATLAEKRKAADRLIDLLIGWATAELGKEPGFPELKKFLDVNLRQDLKNLGLYWWTTIASDNITPGDDTGYNFLSRACLYLHERGYFETKDLPRLLRFCSADDKTPLLAHAQRLIARRMGVSDDSPIPDKLAFIAEPEKLNASFLAYIRTTDEYKKRLAAGEQKGEDIEADRLDEVGHEVANDLFEVALFDFVLHTPDDICVKLFCGRKPYKTNGCWNKNNTVVAWHHSMAPKGTLPTFFFAYWSMPNEEYQKQHFGKMILDGKSLGEYVFWYCTLKPAEAAEWDRFIDGLKPDDDWKSSVKDYRFSFDPKPNPAEPNNSVTSLADKPRSLLLKNDDKK